MITPEVQDRILTLLNQLVLQGKIAFPHQVIREVSGGGQDDLPAIWAVQNSRDLKHPKYPDDNYVKRVSSAVPDLVERGSTKDEADPFVLALALQLKHNDWNAIVVTEDRVDRLPRKRSLKSACKIMGVEMIQTVDFLENIG